MHKLKLLIVEGNTNEENLNFGKAGCAPQSENFKLHVKKIEPDCEIDIVAPGDDDSIKKIILSPRNKKKAQYLKKEGNILIISNGAMIKKSLNKYGLIFFRNQSLNPTNYIKFAKRLEEMKFFPVIIPDTDPTYPDKDKYELN